MKRFLWLTMMLATAAALRAEPHCSTLFGPTYLPFKPASFELLAKVKPKLSESLSIGADLRTIWMSEGAHDQTPRKKTRQRRSERAADDGGPFFFFRKAEAWLALVITRVAQTSSAA